MPPEFFNPDASHTTNRRTVVATIVLLLVGPATLLMADLHWRTGYDTWKVAHLVIFVILFSLLAFGATQAILGYFLLARGGDAASLFVAGSVEDSGPLNAATAVVMPISNESVARVIAGLRVVYESVERTGQLPSFDFFLLSDSSNPNNWIEEEAAWVALTRELNAHGRIFYRRRRLNTNKKAGNLADFCRRWGRHYRYMLVLDADSIMSGPTIVKMARLMERHAKVGIIQALPRLANGETTFARLQQFANRLYGRVFVTGVNYWQLGEANYWGHNAIIRVAPFMEHCSLPDLPGAEPFGGRIMSHDFVEAALMRRAGWAVWLGSDLEGSYEECPANLIDFARRDRRWLQGNLQHAWLVTARGFYALSRLHFALGILSYLASPLWLAFLIISTVIVRRFVSTGLTLLPTDSFAGRLSWNFTLQVLLLFGMTVGLLFVPKVLALLDLRRRPKEVAAFGGWARVLGGVVLETILFTLLAPILMLFHTKFFILTLAKHSVAWVAQRRGRTGESGLSEAFLTHWVHTLVGIGWTILAWETSPALALWLSPILAAFVFSIPMSYWTGRLAPGLALRRWGLFRTPEESEPLPEISRLGQLLDEVRETNPLPELAADYGLLQAVLDPYVNAVHVALLRTKDDPSPASGEHFSGLRERLLRDGPAALTQRDKLSLLMDVDSMNTLHQELWASPTGRLARWWQLAIDHYRILTPTPRTALNR